MEMFGRAPRLPLEMQKIFNTYFVPHSGNDYAPHLLREPMVIGITIVVAVLFGVQLLYSVALPNSNFFAVVLPSVVFELTNTERATAKIGGLTISPLLTAGAEAKANDMATKSYFAHTSPDGKTPWYWFGEVGYRFTYAGENLAVHFNDSETVENAWLNSPGHRANILNPNFTEIGIATAQGIYQGVLTTFIVEEFGRPMATQAESRNQQAGVRATTKNESVASKGLEVVSSNDMSVIVRDNAAIAADVTPLAPHATPSRIMSWIKRALTSPQLMFDLAYGFLAIIVGIAFLIAVVVEIERQHPKHVGYALLLLVLVGGAFLASHALFASRVMVI